MIAIDGSARRAGFVLGLASAVALGACRSEPAFLRLPVEEAYGRVVGTSPVYVVPSRHWQPGPEGGWRFHSTASLFVHLPRPSHEPLEIVIHSAESTREYSPTVRWDGEAWYPEPQPWGEALRLVIQPGRSAPGTHRLDLVRNYPLDATRVAGSRQETDVAAIEYRLGETAGRVSTTAADRHQLLRHFLQSGLTGPGPELLGGALFDGPGELELLASRPGRLRTTIENLGASPVEARLEAGGESYVASVGGRARHDFEGEVQAGGSVRLSVAGPATGLVLAGDLHLLSEPEPDASPSIIFVTLDTTRRDALSPYAEEAPTPHLARFAEGATVFEDALSTSPWTLPSHGSMLTGLWPGRHGGGLAYHALPGHLETLPERLRAAGYYTTGFAGGYLAHHQFGLAQGMYRYRDPDGFETRGEQLTSYVGELLARELPDPLFLFVNFFDPHALYQAPGPLGQRFGVPEAAARLAGRPVWGDLAGGDGERLADAIRGLGGFDDDVRAYLRAAYRAEIAYLDAQVGRLFSLLRDAGRWDESLVVVVADHGELLGERNLFTHGHRLDPELIEIPMMIKFPGQRVGTRVAVPVSQVDLFPTVLRAAGLAIPRGQQGLLLHPEADRALRRRGALYFEEHESAPHPLFPEMRLARDLLGVQAGDWRQVVWDDQSRCEERIEAAWHERPCGERALSRTALEAVMGVSERAEAEAGALTEAEEAALRALGYL